MIRLYDWSCGTSALAGCTVLCIWTSEGLSPALRLEICLKLASKSGARRRSEVEQNDLCMVWKCLEGVFTFYTFLERFAESFKKRTKHWEFDIIEEFHVNFLHSFPVVPSSRFNSSVELQVDPEWSSALRQDGLEDLILIVEFWRIWKCWNWCVMICMGMSKSTWA